MKLYITAVDPDIHNLALAHLTYDTGLKRLVGLKVDIVRIGRSLKGREAAVAMCQHPELRPSVARRSKHSSCMVIVEGQEIAYTGKNNKANPRDLLTLGMTTGAVLAVADADLVLSPTPHEWKGSVPKHIHQCRVLTKAGIKYEMKGGKKPESQYPVPLQPYRFYQEDSGKINPGDWKEINDAIGLGLWGIEKYWGRK